MHRLRSVQEPLQGHYWSEPEPIRAVQGNQVGDLCYGYYSALGGRGTYPYTVILDENGVIVKIFVASVTYEDLKQIVDATLHN